MVGAKYVITLYYMLGSVSLYVGTKTNQPTGKRFFYLFQKPNHPFASPALESASPSTLAGDLWPAAVLRTPTPPNARSKKRGFGGIALGEGTSEETRSGVVADVWEYKGNVERVS